MAVAKTIQTVLKTHGLSRATPAAVQAALPKPGPLAAPVADFRTRMLQHIEHEAAKLPAGATWLASSDIIELVFGHYKAFTARGLLKEVGRLVLLIPALLSQLTAPRMREAIRSVRTCRCQAVGPRTPRAFHACTPSARPATRHETCMSLSRHPGGKLNSLAAYLVGS